MVRRLRSTDEAVAQLNAAHLRTMRGTIDALDRASAGQILAFEAFLRESAVDGSWHEEFLVEVRDLASDGCEVIEACRLVSARMLGLMVERDDGWKTELTDWERTMLRAGNSLAICRDDVLHSDGSEQQRRPT